MIEGLFIANVSVLSSFIIVFFVSAGSFAKLYYYYNRHPTQITQARILKSHMAWTTYSPKYPATYKSIFKYEYKVGSTRYESTAVYFAGTRNIPTKEDRLSYKPNTVHKVFYLKKFPHYAALKNQWLGDQYDCLYVLTFFFIAVVSFFVVNKERKKYKITKRNN